MKSMLITAVLAVSLVAGCNEDENEVTTSSSCTMEELQGKAAKIAEGLQANPAMVQDVMGEVQELGTKLQEVAEAAAASNATEVDQGALNELCAGYDKIIAQF